MSQPSIPASTLKVRADLYTTGGHNFWCLQGKAFDAPAEAEWKILAVRDPEGKLRFLIYLKKKHAVAAARSWFERDPNYDYFKGLVPETTE